MYQGRFVPQIYVIPHVETPLQIAWGRFCDGMYQKSQQASWLDYVGSCFVTASPYVISHPALPVGTTARCCHRHSVSLGAIFLPPYHPSPCLACRACGWATRAAGRRGRWCRACSSCSCWTARGRSSSASTCRRRQDLSSSGWAGQDAEFPAAQHGRVGLGASYEADVPVVTLLPPCLSVQVGDLPAWVWLPYIPHLIISLQRPEMQPVKKASACERLLGETCRQGQLLP